MIPGNGAGKRQPQTGPAGGAIARCISSQKRLEHRRDFFLGDPWSVIIHMNQQAATGLFHRYIRSFAIEGRIADQIAQRPPDQSLANRGNLFVAALIADVLTEIGKLVDDGFD